MMNNSLTKKDALSGLLNFAVTRILILFTGTIFFSVFPQKDKPYRKLSSRELWDVQLVWDRFDSHWYQKLASQGYPQRIFTDYIQETWGFMPLYSICIKFLSALLGSSLFVTGVIFSNCCTLAALYFTYKLVQQKFGTGLQTITLLLICAGSFYLSIVYSEGLFVLLTTLVFYLCHKHRYGWALIIAGLASVTRIQGCLLFAIPTIEILSNNWRNSYKYIPAGLVSVLPMAALMFYLNTTCGQPLAFLNIQHAWGSANLYPLQGLLSLFDSNTPNSSIINTLFWVMILGIVLSCYRKLPLSYVVFSVLYFLLSTSNEMVYGTTRYMLGILPLFVAVSLSNNLVRQFFIALNLLFLAITIATFVTNTATFI